MSRIISYRGLLATGGQDTINLHTNDGKTGYKVIKFQVIPENPFAAADKELVMKIYKIEQTTIDGVVNFSENILLAVAIYSDSDGSAAPVTQSSDVVIFDNEIFNQDIYVTYVDKHGSQSGNYYIELEQVDLTEDQALVAIVKNLRNEQ